MKKICSLFLLLTVMLCLPLTLRAEQLNEGFEDATFAPDGWTSIHVSGSKSWERYSSNHHEGAACAYVMYASSPGHENYLVTPKLLPADGESLSFYVASQSWGGTTLTIEVSTTTAEAASFATTLATYTTGSSGTIGTTSNSTWVEKVIDLSAYAGQEIYVAFHVVDNNGSSLYLDDVTGVSIKEEACPRPKNLALDGDADPTEALIVWEAVAGAEAEGGYELEYSTSEDFTNPQAPSLIEGEAGLLEDLTPATTYYVRVRAFCGEEGYSEWSSTFSFKTKCVAVSAFPWSENFDDITAGSGVLPDCWNRINNSSSYGAYPYVYEYSSYAHSGTNSLYFYTGGSSYYADQYAVLPEMSDLDGKRIVFWARGYNSTSKLKVGRMSNPADASTFVQIGEDIALTTSYQKYAVNMEESGDYIAIMVANLSSYSYNGAYIDDIVVEEVPSCLEPSGLAFVSSETNSAILNWEASESGESEWDIYYSTENVAPTAETVPSIEKTSAKEIQSGLNPSTTYYVWVRAYCNEADRSAWIGGISFKTECAAVSTFPWSENFDDITAGSGVMPDCWKVINNASYYDYYPYVYANTSYSTYSHSGENCLYLYTGGSSSYDDEYAILPEMSDLNGKRIVFWARGYNSTSTIKVGRMTNPADASTFVQIGEDIALTTSYQKFTINMEGEGNYIAFFVANLSSYSTNAAYIDDIVVEDVPSCLEPSGLAFASATTTSATFTWTAGDSETDWDIYYSTENVAPTAETAPIIVKTSAKEIPNGLNPSSTYYVWVRAHCGDSDQSPWVGGISFQTECDAVSALNENFNGYTGSTSASVPAGYPDDQLPTCWQFLNRAASSNSYPQVFISSTSGYAVSGNCLFFKSSSTTPLYAILPELAENISVLQLTFTYRNEGTGSSNGTLYVGYLTDPADASTFVSVDTCEQTTTLTEQEVLFADAPAGSYIAFKYQGGTSNNYYLSIDDVFVGPIPTCQKPADPKCDAKTAHTATLSWTNGAEGQNAWQIVVDTIAAFNPDTVNAARIIDVASNPAIIDGLLSSKTYYAYVRANCGEDGFSAWSKKKVTFTTIAGNIAPSGLAVDGASLASDAATVTWVSAENELHEGFELFYSKINELPEAPEGDSLISNIAEAEYAFAGLEAETTYYVWVRDNCGADGNSAWTSSISFTTLANCPVPGELSVSEIAARSAKIAWNVGANDSYNVRYRTAALDNVLLEQGFEDGIGGWTTSNANSSTGINSSAAHTGSNGFRFFYTTLPPQYLISPEIAGIDADATLEFYYKNYSSSYAESFEVGFSSTDNATSSFAFEAEVTADDQQWHQYSVTVPEGTKYISIKCTSDNAYYLYIDDIVLLGAATPAGEWQEGGNSLVKELTISGLEPETKYEAKVQGVCGVDPTEWSESVFFTTTPSCIKPASLDAEVLSANSVKLDWTAGGEETFFQVVCVLSGEEPNWEGVEPIEALTITIDTLNLDNDYDFYVRAYCGESDHSDFRMVSAHVGYCVPAPTSIDGSGIIAIAFNEEDAYTDIHPTAAPFYADNKAIEFVAHADEIDSILITYSTGYTYGTVIWVDWNKNLAFEASEVVFSGESSESKPTTLSCVFTIPAETELGAYRLRIGGADSFFNGYINGTSSADPDPCGTGTYTIYEDYTLLIVEKPHDPTGLSGAGIENVAIKRIENDQVVIIRNGEKFTIMGVKIQ